MDTVNHDFHAVLQKLGRPVVYYPRVSQAFDDDIRCAVFLSNFSYWEGKQHDEEGWIYKSQAEIKKETGLGRYAQEQARKKLKELGILEEKLINKPPVLHYKFNWAKMNEVLNKHFAGEDIVKLEIEKQDPLLYRMKLAFDDCYEHHSEGIPFDWGKDRKAQGKHWKGLKDLASTFSQRIVKKKLKELSAGSTAEATDDEVIDSFTHFLTMLPEYVVKKFLSPSLIYSKFNEILMEIIKTNGNKPNSSKPSTASDYV